MKSFEEHIRELCALEGISGREDAVRGYLIDELKASPADMEWETDALGNLLVQVKGKHRAGCRLLFAAHMDEIGKHDFLGVWSTFAFFNGNQTAERINNQFICVWTHLLFNQFAYLFFVSGDALSLG